MAGHSKADFRMVKAILKLALEWPGLWSRPIHRSGTPLIERFAILGVPTYFLLDPSGRLVGMDYDGVEGRQRLERDIQRLIQ